MKTLCYVSRRFIVCPTRSVIPAAKELRILHHSTVHSLYLFGHAQLDRLLDESREWRGQAHLGYHLHSYHCLLVGLRQRHVAQGLSSFMTRSQCPGDSICNMFLSQDLDLFLDALFLEIIRRLFQRSLT